MMVDSLTQDEIDKIADAVVEKLMPLLKKLGGTGPGFLTINNVENLLDAECEQQVDDSVKTNLTGFNESLYE